MIAMIVLALVMLSVARSFLFMNQRTVETQERAFAAQKAIQMMEELRGLISNTNSATIGILDDYDDGVTTSAILTTNKSVTSPADYLSGNPRGKFVRRVNVVAMANEPLARRVHVRVYRAGSEEPLAETVSVIRTISNQYASTQVFDVYVIAIENVPGWWVSLSSMKPMFDNVIQDLQTRNPGLEWRTHWVTRLSYGRDPYYTPVLNEATKTNVTAPDGVYFYPGKMDKPNVGEFLYYVPDYFSARVNVDGTVRNAASYPIADQYNHAVRYPEEEELYAQAVDAANAAGDEPPELSLRMLVERMNNGSSLDNVLLVNLHGELLPLPPIRNYSDPAKDPENRPHVRAVTHPENLEVPSGAAVKLRVHTFVTNPDAWTSDSVLSTTTILLRGHELDTTDLSIRRVVGSDVVPYAWQNAVSGTDFNLTTDNGNTILQLYGSPLRHPLNGNDGGIPAGDRLYGLEYIPCLVGAMPDFQESQMDLAWPNHIRPKNTARWVITLNAGVIPDGRLEVQTRVGDDVTTGTSAHQPANVSRTYSWIGQSAPITERYQYMGDPRHMPYADVKNDHGYNWYFSSINSSDYQGYTKAVNGWNGELNIDVPRFFQLFRAGLLNTNGFFTSMTGFSFYYVGLGGEMGYDASNGFPSGLPIIRTPWNPGSASAVGVDEITNAQSEPYARVISRTDNSWWGLHWIGELYPDDEFAAWESDGNLPIGSGNFYRARYSDKGFAFDPQKRTNQRGASSFFNGNQNGSGNRYFTHEYADGGSASVTSTGLQLAQDFNFPLLGSLTAARPFQRNSNSSDRQPPEWLDTAYSSVRTTLSAAEIYYEPGSNSSSQDASALIRMELGSDRGNMVMNGLSPQNDFGAAQISKLCAINLIRGFMALGAPAVAAARVPQVPLVSISSPSATQDFVDPATIDVDWGSSWVRWDSRPYTSAYPTSYSEATALTYNVKYSNDNGKSWTFLDGSAAEPGVMDAGRAATTPVAWDASALPRGTYVVRVEAFRSGVPLHYTYHQRQIYIQR